MNDLIDKYLGRYPKKLTVVQSLTELPKKPDLTKKLFNTVEETNNEIERVNKLERKWTKDVRDFLGLENNSPVLTAEEKEYIRKLGSIIIVNKTLSDTEIKNRLKDLIKNPRTKYLTDLEKEFISEYNNLSDKNLYPESILTRYIKDYPRVITTNKYIQKNSGIPQKPIISETIYPAGETPEEIITNLKLKKEEQIRIKNVLIEYANKVRKYFRTPTQDSVLTNEEERKVQELLEEKEVVETTRTLSDEEVKTILLKALNQPESSLSDLELSFVIEFRKLPKAQQKLLNPALSKHEIFDKTYTDKKFYENNESDKGEFLAYENEIQRKHKDDADAYKLETENLPIKKFLIEYKLNKKSKISGSFGDIWNKLTPRQKEYFIAVVDFDKIILNQIYRFVKYKFVPNMILTNDNILELAGYIADKSPSNKTSIEEEFQITIPDEVYNKVFISPEFTEADLERVNSRLADYTVMKAPSTIFEEMKYKSVNHIGLILKAASSAQEELANDYSEGVINQETYDKESQEIIIFLENLSKREKVFNNITADHTNYIKNLEMLFKRGIKDLTEAAKYKGQKIDGEEIKKKVITILKKNGKIRDDADIEEILKTKNEKIKFRIKNQTEISQFLAQTTMPPRMLKKYNLLCTNVNGTLERISEEKRNEGMTYYSFVIDLLVLGDRSKMFERVTNSAFNGDFKVRLIDLIKKTSNLALGGEMIRFVTKYISSSVILIKNPLQSRLELRRARQTKALITYRNIINNIPKNNQNLGLLIKLKPYMDYPNILDSTLYINTVNDKYKTTKVFKTPNGDYFLPTSTFFNDRYSGELIIGLKEILVDRNGKVTYLDRIDMERERLFLQKYKKTYEITLDTPIGNAGPIRDYIIRTFGNKMLEKAIFENSKTVNDYLDKAFRFQLLLDKTNPIGKSSKFFESFLKTSGEVFYSKIVLLPLLDIYPELYMYTPEERVRITEAMNIAIDKMKAGVIEGPIFIPSEELKIETKDPELLYNLAENRDEYKGVNIDWLVFYSINGKYYVVSKLQLYILAKREEYEINSITFPKEFVDKFKDYATYESAQYDSNNKLLQLVAKKIIDLGIYKEDNLDKINLSAFNTLTSNSEDIPIILDIFRRKYNELNTEYKKEKLRQNIILFLNKDINKQYVTNRDFDELNSRYLEVYPEADKLLVETFINEIIYKDGYELKLGDKCTVCLEQAAFKTGTLQDGKLEHIDVCSTNCANKLKDNTDLFSETYITRNKVIKELKKLMIIPTDARLLAKQIESPTMYLDNSGKWINLSLLEIKERICVNPGFKFYLESKESQDALDFIFKTYNVKTIEELFKNKSFEKVYYKLPTTFDFYNDYLLNFQSNGKIFDGKKWVKFEPVQEEKVDLELNKIRKILTEYLTTTKVYPTKEKALTLVGLVKPNFEILKQFDDELFDYYDKVSDLSHPIYKLLKDNCSLDTAKQELKKFTQDFKKKNKNEINNKSSLMYHVYIKRLYMQEIIKKFKCNKLIQLERDFDIYRTKRKAILGVYEDLLPLINNKIFDKTIPIRRDPDEDLFDNLDEIDITDYNLEFENMEELKTEEDTEIFAEDVENYAQDEEAYYEDEGFGEVDYGEADEDDVF